MSTSEIRYPSGGAAAAGVVAGYVPGARLVVDDSVTAGSVVLVVSKSFSGLSTPTTAAPAPSSRASPAPATPQPGSLAPVPGACQPRWRARGGSRVPHVLADNGT